MLAKRLPSILPTLTAEESIETRRIYSSLGRLKPGQPLMATLPFRAPHHTISNAGLVVVRPIRGAEFIAEGDQQHGDARVGRTREAATNRTV